MSDIDELPPVKQSRTVRHIFVIVLLLFIAVPMVGAVPYALKQVRHYRQTNVPAASSAQNAPTALPVVRSASASVLPSFSSSSGSSSISPFSLSSASSVSAPSPHRAKTAIGVYIGAGRAGNDAYLDELFTSLHTASGDAIVFDVKGSRVYFSTAHPLIQELGLSFPLLELPHVVEKMKSRGIYTIGRFIALKDAGLAAVRDDALIRHPQTGRAVGREWVDGAAPITLEYNRAVLTEVVRSGIDEVNFDYIRYPTEYDQSLIGLSGKEKSDHIMEFLLMARDVVDEEGRGTIIGISTYAILGWNFGVNFEPLGQDIPRFADVVDIVSPMAYPSTFAPGYYYVPGRDPRSRMYYLVWKTLEGYKMLVGPENVSKIRPWIQGYGTTEKDFHEQMDAVFDAGLCGFTVWNAGNKYGSFLKAWGSRPVRPEKCAGM